MEFTAQKVFDITLGLMNENVSNSPSFKTYFLPTLNTVLGEVLEQENLLRYRDGMEELTAAPYIEDMAAEINLPKSANVILVGCWYGFVAW